MKKIDKQIDMNDTRIQITSTSLKLLWRIVEKQDEIIDWINKVKYFKGTSTGHELWLYKKDK